MAVDVTAIVAQISDVISLCEAAIPTSETEAGGAQARRDIIPLAKQTVDRFARPTTPFHQMAEQGFRELGNSLEALSKLLSALRSLKLAYEKGHMQSFEELVHAELFSDFLEQAEYLLESHFKDAAAVIAGGVFEEHLRKLCLKSGLPTTEADAHGKIKPKKLDTINSDLAKASVYDKNEQKQVTAWAGLRNEAAHGDYGKYDAARVQLMIMWLRGFVTKYPA